MSADKLEAVRGTCGRIQRVKPECDQHRNFARCLRSQNSFRGVQRARPECGRYRSIFDRFDHAALTGMFGEPPTERPSPTSFDQSFAEILGGRPPLSSNTPQSRPGFDHQGFAEILSEPRPVSTNTKPSQPRFDHQALAEMLTESRADPINPPISPLGFDTESSSSSAPFSGQIEQMEPEAKAFTASPPTNAEGAQPPRAKSLLAKLHHIFSTKEEPLLLKAENAPLLPSLSGQPHTREPMAKGISTPAEGAFRDRQTRCWQNCCPSASSRGPHHQALQVSQAMREPRKTLWPPLQPITQAHGRR
jgi:hypothetical protein